MSTFNVEKAEWLSARFSTAFTDCTYRANNLAKLFHRNNEKTDSSGYRPHHYIKCLYFNKEEHLIEDSNMRKNEKRIKDREKLDGKKRDSQ